MTPKAKHDGASSYKIVRHLEERTIVEVKDDLLAQAKLHKSWQVIHQEKSCERNDEGILPLNHSSLTVESVQACQDLCNKHDTCAAVDYYRKTQYCIFYAEPCMRPMAVHNQPVSMKYKLEEPRWVTIDAEKACENSKEGVKRMQPYGGRVEASLANCQEACLQRKGCIAVDYYRNTTWCNFYDEACSTPLSTSDQPSSYRLVRTAGAGKPVKPPSKIADTIVAEASSVVTTAFQGPQTKGYSHEHRWHEQASVVTPPPQLFPSMMEHNHEKEM
jgi:hypothetical protein